MVRDHLCLSRFSIIEAVPRECVAGNMTISSGGMAGWRPTRLRDWRAQKRRRKKPGTSVEHIGIVSRGRDSRVTFAQRVIHHAGARPAGKLRRAAGKEVLRDSRVTVW